MPEECSHCRSNQHAVICTGGDVQRALVLVTSQKTLTVAVPVLSSLAQHSPHVSVSMAAIAIVPCMFVHLLQTVIDFVLVAQWIRQDSIDGESI